MNHVNKIFRVTVDMIMTVSHFPSGRKGIICTAFGDISASDVIFAASKESIGDVNCLSVRNLDSNKNVTKVVGSSESNKRCSLNDDVASWGR